MPPEIKIHFIRNYTAEPIGIAVQEQAKELALSVTTQFGAYDNLGAEIATLASAAELPSIVMVTIDLDYFSGWVFSPKWDLAHARNDLEALLKAIDALPAATFVLISTFIPPFRTSLP